MATILSQFLSALFSLLVGLKKFQILHLRREDFHGLRKTMILYQDTIYGLHDRTGDANHCNRRSFWNYWLHCRLHRQPSGMVRCMCTSDPLLLQDDERQHTDIDLKTILGQKIFILQKYENIADGMTQTILT